MKIESGRFLNNYIEPNKRQYCIPVFQRDYAWTTEQCEKLFDDIVLAYEKDRLHFCGTFVYAPLTTKNHIDYFIIIDGQQRFTTLYILIKALADSAEEEADREALEEYLYNKDKFNRYGWDEKSKLKLKPVKTDNDQLKLLLENKLDRMDKSKSGKIYQNYVHFMDLIKGFLDKKEDNSVRMIHDGIDKLICADIRLEADDDAQEIFERINSTGIKLSLSDLIRNYVLMTDDDQERLYEEYWLEVQKLLGKDKLEDFFLDYINMRLDGFTKESEAYKDFKKVFDHEKYTNESVLQEILHYARQYSVFCLGAGELNDVELKPEIVETLKGLRKLNQTTVYIFLFHVFDDLENGTIDQDELSRVLKLLLNYSIRRLVCEIGSNSLRGFYKTLHSRVYHCPENKAHYYDALVSFLLQLNSKDVMPSDAEFETALKETNIYRKNALCRYILLAIENQGKEKVVADNLTIEHIMPQNKKLPVEWQEMLGEEWQFVHEKYLHILGNLTLTGYNSEYSDRPFPEKKEMMEETGTHVTNLYSDVRDKDCWNKDTIEQRTIRLANEVLKLYAIEKAEYHVEFSDPRYKLYTVANPKNAKHKDVSYYVLLGERVNVDSFAYMVRSVARKLYALDASIIENMAKNEEVFRSWVNPVFSYDKTKVKNPMELIEGEGLYIATGYSASDCIWFIKSLLNRYELNLEEDFAYCATK